MGLWKSRAQGLAKCLALPHTVAPASDPFFGRAGKLMAMSQIQQSLKFELLISCTLRAASYSVYEFELSSRSFWNDLGFGDRGR